MPNTAADLNHLLIIGPGPAIDAAVATRFAKEGFRVTLVARRKSTLHKIAAQVRTTGANVTSVAADASDPAELRATLERIATASTPPGVVVYNAALMEQDNLLTSTADHLMTAYAVDVVGAIVTAQVYAQHMEKAGSGT